MLGLGIIIPVAPFYAKAFGADAVQVGLMFTAFAVMQFLTTPVLGALSDRHGRRPILLLSLFGEAVGYVMLGLATSLPLLYAARIVSGATSGNIGAAQAYIADITPPPQRTRTFGLVGAAFGAGFLFGPAFGGLLSSFDVRFPAFAAAALVLLNLVFAYLRLPESLPHERRSVTPIRQHVNPVGVLLTLLGRPHLRAPLLATFLLNLAFAGFQTNFAVFVSDRFGYGPIEVGQLFFASGVMSVVAQTVVVNRLSTRYTDVPILLGGVAITAAGYLFTGFNTVGVLLWAIMPVLSLGSSLWRPALASMVSKLVSSREQGLVNGGSQAMASLAAIVGPIFTGVVYEAVGPSSPYWSAALVLGLVAAVMLSWWRDRTDATAVSAAGP